MDVLDERAQRGRFIYRQAENLLQAAAAVRGPDGRLTGAEIEVLQGYLDALRAIGGEVTA